MEMLDTEFVSKKDLQEFVQLDDLTKEICKTAIYCYRIHHVEVPPSAKRILRK
jgi:hypothetical protein